MLTLWKPHCHSVNDEAYQSITITDCIIQRYSQITTLAATHFSTMKVSRDQILSDNTYPHCSFSPIPHKLNPIDEHSPDGKLLLQFNSATDNIDTTLEVQPKNVINQQQLTHHNTVDEHNGNKRKTIETPETSNITPTKTAKVHRDE